MIRCAVDPGREKFGWAFADMDTLLFSGIVPTTEIPHWCDTFSRREWKDLSTWRLEGVAPTEDIEPPILLGDGTAARTFADAFTRFGIAFRLIDERNSTLRARGLYWRLHPPHGWRRLLPISLLLPPRPLDDLAAWSMLLDA